MNTEQLFDQKYKIVRVLGQGGMSKVFLAENVKLNTLWAIKEIRKDKNQHVDLLAEPNALKKLRHPSLPRIFDIIENEEYIYIIQDYIEGTDVSELLKVDPQIEEERVLKWAKQIADVYIYLHNMKPNPMIYRDMKPGNLIVDQEDNIKVIDFGIAREYKEGLTVDTTLLGTKGYAAPEQYGTGQTDRRTDIYSLGITLLHMLTGIGPTDPAFDTNTLVEEVNVSSGMLNVLKKCVEKNPENRFENAEELKDALENVHEWNREYQELKKSQNQFKTITACALSLSVIALFVGSLILKNALETKSGLWSGVIGLAIGLFLGILSWYSYQKLQSLVIESDQVGQEAENTYLFKKFKKIKMNTKPAMAFISPRSTGKTEIACNTAWMLSKMGKKVILLDLDHESYGTIYNFPVDPGEDYENYYKLRLLMSRVNTYLKGETAELSSNEINS